MERTTDGRRNEREAQGKRNTIVLRGDWVSIIKNKIKLMRLLNYFFSWPIYIIRKNPSTEPSTTPSQRWNWEGFASFPLATPLDPANGFTMVVFFLDGLTLVDHPFVRKKVSVYIGIQCWVLFWKSFVTQKVAPRGSFDDAPGAISKKVLFYIGFQYWSLFWKRFRLPKK